MQIQRKWIAVGIGVLLLVLGGISVLSLSEQEEVETMAASDFREENEYTDTEKDSNGQRRAVRVYDTALYLRARPPTDPFHASEVLPGETTMETVGPEEIPVSYTHLDVYKRQIHAISLWAEMDTLSAMYTKG